jgi:hypothetical protein
MAAERRSSQSLLRLGAAALLLLYAAVVVGDGIDRMARRNPLVAGLVPASFAAAALSPLAAASLMMHDNAASLGNAGAAVAVAPLEPSNAGLLGSALFAQGRTAAAEAAFRVAGQMGWRDQPTQAYWLQSALLAGDWDVAARRLDAMLRLNPALTRQYLLLAAFESNPKGRDALVERLVQRPNWMEAYFSPGDDISRAALDDRGDIFAGLQARIPLGCDIGAGYAAQLVAAGEVARGHAIWRDSCSQRDASLVHDPNFVDIARRVAVPFDWQLVPNSSVTAVPADAGNDAEGGGKGLRVRNDAPIARAFARQMIVAPVGNYRLSWREGPSVAGAGSRIEAMIACGSEDPRKLDAGRGIDGRITAEFSANGECEGRWLTFLIGPGTGDVHVWDVRLGTR